MEIAGLLGEQGMMVVGPAASLDCARQLLRAGGFDVALVDVSLHGEPASDVLAALRLAEVPFAL